jgi:group I intron endonuclease
MKKYNYVYRITNKILKKYYYGSRSSEIEAKLDLGIKYFSSSSDEDFREDQKNHPENYKYKIVRICSTRKEATDLEIKLQKKFNVGINESFYNKVIQTSTGFDRTGTTQTPETKQKMSEANKGENNPMYGKEHTPESKLKMSEAQKGENHPMFGKEHSDETRQKISEANKGVPKSDEHKQKISEAKTGENHHMFGKNHSDETKLKMSEAQTGENNPMYGKEHSDETRQKMSEAHKGVPKGPQEQVECPHCGKIGGISAMKRWHFDNCKNEEIEE